MFKTKFLFLMHVYTLTNTRLIQTAETRENKEFHVQNSSLDLRRCRQPFLFSRERAFTEGISKTSMKTGSSSTRERRTTQAYSTISEIQ